MSFNSLVFLIYLVIVVTLYYVIPHKLRWGMLLVASYIFYAYWNFYLIFLIVGTTLISYFAGILISKIEKQWQKNLWLILTLVVCLGCLLFFKYFNFLSGSVTSIIQFFGVKADPFFLNLILPVGISFYTFQTLSYVIDVYRETIEAETHLGYYALFVSFFPQLVAGPIERPENLIPQLKEIHKFDKNNLIDGFKIALGGFVKKVVVADTLASFVNAVYNAGDFNEITGLSVLLATLLFMIQIYCDFSGYSDIATGCAKMLGVDLMVNFDRPFISETLSEFWTRWHISLSSWFKDYVYIPLNYRCLGKKHLKTRLYVNLLIVFLISGLWHGANWTFVLWGIYNGVVQVVGGLLKKPFNWLNKKLGFQEKDPRLRIWRIFRTIFVSAFGLILFRSNTVENAFAFYGKIFTNWSFTASYWTETFSIMGMDVIGALTAVLLLVVMFAVDRLILEPRAKDLPYAKRGKVATTHYIYLVWLVMAAWLLLIARGQSSGFIYFQF